MAKYDATHGDHVALALKELFEVKRNAGEITSKFEVPPKGTTFGLCLLFSYDALYAWSSGSSTISVE